VQGNQVSKWFNAAVVFAHTALIYKMQTGSTFDGSLFAEKRVMSII